MLEIGAQVREKESSKHQALNHRFYKCVFFLLDMCNDFQLHAQSKHVTMFSWFLSRALHQCEMHSHLQQLFIERATIFVLWNNDRLSSNMQFKHGREGTFLSMRFQLMKVFNIAQRSTLNQTNHRKFLAILILFKKNFSLWFAVVVAAAVVAATLATKGCSECSTMEFFDF